VSYYGQGRRALLTAGFLAWLAVGLQHFYELWASPALRADPSRLACSAAFALFGAAYIAGLPGRLSAPWAVALLAAETAAALWLSYYPYGAFSALFCVTAPQAAFRFPPATANRWTAAQAAATLAVFLFRPDMSLGVALSAGGMYGAFELFALVAARSVMSEARSREELAIVNAKLVAVQRALAEHARTEERANISRELHDSVGHHLTALALKLELASHAPPEAGAQHAREARQMVADVLAEMRSVVTALREDGDPELSARLAAMAGRIPEPRIHLQVPSPLHVPDPSTAHAVYRCVQEIITNAVRHARARNLWIDVGPEEGGLAIRARDDGVGAQQLDGGLGLKAMRERVEQSGGRIDVQSTPGEGVALEVWLPVPPAA